MDTYIAGDPALESTPTLHARLPGEPEPGHAEASLDPPLRAGPRTAPSTPSAPHRNGRKALLATAAVVGVLVVFGGAFVLSPYNTVIPVPASARMAVTRAENQVALLWGHPNSPPAPRASNGGLKTAVAAPLPPAHPLPAPAPVPQLPPPLAPAATLAGVHPVQQPVTVMQPPYKPRPQGLELAELLGLGQAIPPVSAPLPAPPQPHQGPPQPADGATPEQNKAVPAVERTPSTGPIGKTSPDPRLQSTVTTAWTAAPDSSAAQPPAPHVGQTAAAVTPGSPAALEAPTPLAAPGSLTNARLQIAAAPPASPAIPPKVTPAGDHLPAANAAALAPTNPLVAVDRPQAAPMSSDQQVQVLELVTQLAALIRDQKTQIANLQGDIQKSDGATGAKLVDFERRLALVEANSAMAAASTPLTTAATPSTLNPAGSAASAIPVALMSAKAALSGARQDLPTAASPVAPAGSSSGQSASATPTQYHVQAASPGLAMLAAVDRGGGDGAQIQVQVGDTVPGYGRVLSVQQKGTNWVVQTQNGTIK